MCQRKGRSGESRGDRKPLVSCPLLPLSVGTDTSGPPKAANVHAHLERKLASSGAPLYRRKIYRQQTVKKERGGRFIFTLRLENAIIMLYICVQKGGGNLKKKITKKHFCFAVTVRFYLTRRMRKCVTVKTEFGKAFIITIVWRILSIPRIWQER